MLIAHKALQTLKAKGVPQFAEFAQLLDDTSKAKNYKAYVNLGSMGPDLYYYANLVSSAKDILTEGFVQATGVTPWSYHLHSHKPNEFPLALVEILFSDAIKENGQIKLLEDDIRKLAYIAGHLTHIAADQIIHPIVNDVAGPYYRRGDNRRKHRQCEVFQDFFLYEEVYRLEEKTGRKYDFFKQDFRRWADCVRSLTTRNSEDWFRYFLQRGFVETYGCCPDESQIENSIDNLLLTLRTCQKIGPYKTAAEDYQQNDKNPDSFFTEYIGDIKYIKHYRIAVELAVVYLIALYEVYFTLEQGQDFKDEHKERFLSIVSDADLSCPLTHNIYEKALAALENKTTMVAFVRKHSSSMIAKTRFVTTDAILSCADDKAAISA
jgi:hypothetical protein